MFTIKQRRIILHAYSSGKKAKRESNKVPVTKIRPEMVWMEELSGMWQFILLIFLKHVLLRTVLHAA